MMSAAKSRSFWVPFVILETLFPLLALVAISIMQSPTRHAATFHCVVTLLGIGFTYFGWEFVFERSRVAVRRLLTASIIYLPLLYGLKRDVTQSSQMIHTPTFGRFRKVGHISHIFEMEKPCARSPNPVWTIVLLALLYGAFTSLQYASMSTLVFADIGEEDAHLRATVPFWPLSCKHNVRERRGRIKPRLLLNTTGERTYGQVYATRR
jgi:hypothetical protein